jgi:hypothetical protein
VKRSVFLLLVIVCFFPSSSTSQSDGADPYSVHLVRMAMQNHAEGIIIAKVQTHIQRMGDRVSIALLKDLSDADLIDRQKIEKFLPIIRDCFSQPQLIDVEMDQQPKVTLFLLKYVRQSVYDPQVKRDLDETIRFVTDKTAK